MKWIISLLLLTSFELFALGFTKTISQQELQSQLQNITPITKKKWLMSVTISEPKIQLRSGQNGIEFTAKITASAPGNIKGEGRGTVAGDIEYRPQQGAFYLTSIELKSFSVNDMPQKLLPQVQAFAQKQISKAMRQYPIYKLDDTDLKQQLLKSSLKRVEVMDQALKLEFELF